MKMIKLFKVLSLVLAFQLFIGGAMPAFKVQIKYPLKNRLWTVENVTSETTIKELKNSCKDKYVVKQDIEFSLNGIALDDNKTLGNYGINETTTLTMQISSVEPTGPIDINLKKHEDGSTYKITVDPAKTTVGKIKQMFFEKYGVPVEEQRVVFASKILEDDRLLQDYSPSNDITFFVVQQKPLPGGQKRITVKTLTGKKIELIVTDDMTVKALKEMIAQAEPTIKVEQQRLIHAGTPQENDDKTIKEIGIKDNAEIYLIIRLLPTSNMVYVMDPDGNKRPLNFESDFDLDSTIARLKQAFSGITGIPVEKQKLLYAGKMLEDDKTMRSYGIDKESTIHCILRLGSAPIPAPAEKKSQTIPQAQTLVNPVMLATTAALIAALGIAAYHRKALAEKFNKWWSKRKKQKESPQTQEVNPELTEEGGQGNEKLQTQEQE